MNTLTPVSSQLVGEAAVSVPPPPPPPPSTPRPIATTAASYYSPSTYLLHLYSALCPHLPTHIITTEANHNVATRKALNIRPERHPARVRSHRSGILPAFCVQFFPPLHFSLTFALLLACCTLRSQPTTVDSCSSVPVGWKLQRTLSRSRSFRGRWARALLRR